MDTNTNALLNEIEKMRKEQLDQMEEEIWGSKEDIKNTDSIADRED